jgi:predicted RNA-binding Zn-ribbon protein involved in translation (DUF1610 family)
VAGSGSAPDDALDRLFRCLVENLAALDAEALVRPFPVTDIAERLVPYRTHRAVLGVDSGEDYEMTVLRLVAGERGYLDVFPAEVRETFASEAGATNPETGIFRQFPEATALLAPERVAEVRGGALQPRDEPGIEPEPDFMPSERDEEPAGDEDDASERPPFMLADDADDEAGRPAARPRAMTASTPCSYCGANLPVGRAVLFCPHCGQNVGVVHCQTCGAELDVGWTFCISCGQKVTGL